MSAKHAGAFYAVLILCLGFVLGYVSSNLNNQESGCTAKIIELVKTKNYDALAMRSCFDSETAHTILIANGR